MEKRRLGSLEVSVLGLSCAHLGVDLDDRESVRLVGAAIDLGVTYLATTETEAAGVAEEHLGKAVGNRDDVVIATAVGTAEPDLGLTRGSPVWIRRAVDRSLRRLGRDWIDHYVLDGVDPATPLEETLGALHGLVVAGKVREIGGAGLTPGLVEEAAQAGRELDLTPLRSLYLDYSVSDRGAEKELIPAAVEQGWAIVTKLPPGWADEPGDPAGDGVAATLARFARSRDRDPVELQLSWLVGRDAVASVVVPAREPGDMGRWLGGLGWAMTEDELGEIDEISAAA